ncbi:MAG: spore cortex biosynthesis protein YabQ [Defluviitaleaceae bacterium]|nr:spore cortex biosynthesis protein YabQ [Defluviitaleaceae bacterium]
MILSMSGQAWLFLSTVLAGAAIGLFFDVFRILRKTAPRLAASAFAVQLEDFLFWVIVTVGMFYFMLNRNYGEIRVFAVLGAFLGIALYFVTISKWVIFVCVAIIEYLKKVVKTAVKIILMPLRFLLNLVSPVFKKMWGKVRSGLCRIKLSGRIRMRKFSRNWFILRHKK